MKTNSIRTLGLLFPLAILILALGASAAQAKWLILLGSGETKTLLIEGTVHVTLALLLVPNIPQEIHCKLGTGVFHTSLNSTHTHLLSSAIVTFTDCFDPIWEETCEVRGATDGAKEITVSWSGEGGMEGESVFVAAESGGAPFADLVYVGEECPLAELDGKMTGSIRFDISNPLTHSSSHGMTLTEQELAFGESGEAVLENNEGGTPTGTLTTAQAVSIHLVEL